jgi:hypothetical protein
MLSKIQDFLIPNFLKRLDFWLMTHKPHVWRTRGHFVVFYGIIVALLFFLFGLMYPQTLYELSDAGRSSTNISFLFTLLSFLLVTGAVFGWWYSIQKYPYKRTSVVHFILEISIYTIGLFALWSVIWAFYFGFFYKRCYMLEKNKAEDKTWFYEHDFSSFGYMPHVQINKLNDLNAYFGNGEKLVEIQRIRGEKTIKDRQYSNRNSFNLGDIDFSSHLDDSDWEFKTNYMQKKLPPQYLTYSDYFNHLIVSDSLRLIIRKQNKIDTDISPNDENKYLFDFILPGLNFNEIEEATTNTYARYYHQINFAEQADDMLKRQVSEWIAHTDFLESLNDSEIVIYKNLLLELNEYYKDYIKTMVTIKQPLSAAYIELKARTPIYDRTFYHFPEKNYYSRDNINFSNSDKNVIASEKYAKALLQLDENSAKKLNLYLEDCDHSFSTFNIKDKASNEIIDKSYAAIKHDKIDSLLFFDYYFLDYKNYDTYRSFYTKAYLDYLVNRKYKEKDFDRLHNLLTVNSFPNNSPNYHNSKLHKIQLLIQSQEYYKANHNLENLRDIIKNEKLLLWSPFSLVYCLLGAVVFYLVTLSSGVQFWLSLFIAGVYWALMGFMSELFKWGREIYTDGERLPNQITLPFIFMIVHIMLLPILLLWLYKSKNQWNKAHFIVNPMLISGLGASLAASLYWQEKIKTALLETNNYTYSEYFYIKITTNVFLVTILIYGLIAWLFKRHLTYPKKK